MATQNTHVKPYAYARIHIRRDADANAPFRDLLAQLDTRPLEGPYKDGDHFFGRLIDYAIGSDDSVRVVISPMWRVQSNDYANKWHLTGWKMAHWESTFENCKRLGAPDRSRARFMVPGGLLLMLSRSRHDRELIEHVVTNG